MLVRRAWVGEPPRHDFDGQLDVYRDYTPEGGAGAVGRAARWSTRPDRPTSPTGSSTRCERSGCDALNLRVHVPGVGPEAAREQIARLGDEVVGRAPGRELIDPPGD